MGLFVVSGFFFLVVFVSGTVEHLLMFIVVVYFLIYIVVISGIIEAPIEALGPRLLPGLLGARRGVSVHTERAPPFSAPRGFVQHCMMPCVPTEKSEVIARKCRVQFPALPGFAGFCRLLPGVAGVCQVLPGFAGCTA